MKPEALAPSLLVGTGATTGRFRPEAAWVPLTGDAAGWDVTLEIRLEGDEPVDASLAFAIHLPADDDPRWLVPGLFYGDNRPADSRAHHPRWVEATAEAPGDPFASPDWWFRADRCATPAVFATGKGTRYAVATRERSAIGQPGIGFGTVDTDTGLRRQLRLAFPYRELPVVYDGGPEPQPADCPTHRWQPGDVVRLEARVYAVPDGADADAAILRDLHAWLAGKPIRPPIDADAAASLAADGLLAWHYRAGEGVLIETAAFDRDHPSEPDRLAMHVAWLSGAPAASALLQHGRRTGRADATDAGTRVLDGIAANLAPCGTFWGQWTADHGWTKGWTPGPDALHARTIAEATLFMARAARLAERRPWRDAVRSNAAFVLGHQRPDGAIPSAWNGTSGDVISWDGTAGLAWVPALSEASRLLGDPTLLDAARRAGAHYADAVEHGRLAGAPEDVDRSPTSEDGYVALMAYVALARADDASRGARLTLARRAADWMLGFRYVYDVDVPPDSPLGRIGFRSTGFDMASPANQHLHAYGLICTGELVALSRLLGDRRYATAAAEQLAAARQVIVREDGMLGGRRGMMPERLYQTRYDGEKGDIGPLSHAWCLGLLLHAAELAVVTPELADG